MPTEHPSNASNAHDSPPQSLSEVATAVLDTARGLLDDGLRLVATEARLAALSLSAILALAVAGAVLAVSAWLLVLAALAAGLVSAGVSIAAALLAVALANVLLCWAAFVVVKRLSRNLLLRSTRRQIAGKPALHKDKNVHVEKPIP